jgi:hypothetical protein
MTRTTNARIAGFAFLFYIAVGIGQMVLGGAISAPGTAARLALMAQHTSRVQVELLLTLLTSMTALTLAVALYAITRDEDRDLAILALCCRVGEGMLGMIAPMITLGLLWLATATEVGTTVRDTPATLVLAGFLRKLGGWNTITAAMLFAIGSTIFSWLLLRGRMIPRLLAWLGVAASVLLVVLLPLELAGAVSGPVTKIMWLPMAAFEIPLGLWLLTKGVAPPARRQSS